jgi:hypothetical protein
VIGRHFSNSRGVQVFKVQAVKPAENSIEILLPQCSRLPADSGYRTQDKLWINKKGINWLAGSKIRTNVRTASSSSLGQHSGVERLAWLSNYAHD